MRLPGSAAEVVVLGHLFHPGDVRAVGGFLSTAAASPSELTRRVAVVTQGAVGTVNVWCAWSQVLAGRRDHIELSGTPPGARLPSGRRRRRTALAIPSTMSSAGIALTATTPPARLGTACRSRSAIAGMHRNATSTASSTVTATRSNRFEAQPNRRTFRRVLRHANALRHLAEDDRRERGARRGEQRRPAGRSRRAASRPPGR